ncbi:hypothetical protein [Streptomyces sp. NPDC051677]|uniref:hypothetical protein n=1 Tax=Streptomyces sp. NPDC051677 TaxID=3365669 RepID=UPI0037D6019D
MTSPAPAFYRDQQAWRDLQQLLPTRPDPGRPTTRRPRRSSADWRGHRVHLDCYRNPDAQAKVVLARRGFETVALDDLGYGLTQVRPDTTRRPQAHVAGSRRSAGSGRWTPRGR